MPVHKLLLHPEDPALRVPVDRLAAALQALGLIGTARQLDGGCFYPAGEHFLQLITFLGCSPSICIEPPEDAAQVAAAVASGTFCHVMLETRAQPWFRADPRTAAPRCPNCRSTPGDWREACTAAGLPGSPPWHCAGCGQVIDCARLAFRKTAALASSWVEIRGIYPSEAVAGSALLQCLHDISGAAWRTIYLQE